MFGKGDPVAGMYVVVYGEIRLIARSAVRGERLTGVVRAGRSFGEPMMFLEKPAVVEAQAATDALVLQLPKQAVFDELERNPRFARRMIAGLSQRIESLVQEVERLSHRQRPDPAGRLPASQRGRRDGTARRPAAGGQGRHRLAAEPDARTFLTAAA